MELDWHWIKKQAEALLKIKGDKNHTYGFRIPKLIDQYTGILRL